MNFRIESSFNAGYISQTLSREYGKQCVDGGYNLMRENILDKASSLYREQPDFLILLPWWDFFESGKVLTRTPFDILSEKIEISLESDVAFFFDLIDVALERLPYTTVLIVAPPIPFGSALGILDDNLLEYSVTEPLERLKHLIANRCKNSNRLTFCGLDAVFRRYGWENLIDNRVDYLSKSPFSKEGLNKASEYLAKVVDASAKPSRKVIVCDLDNTLWGGVLGEDGIDKIRISADGPAKAFYDFQCELKQLAARGILLVIVSKNNESDVVEMLREHPDQILRFDDFVGHRINWKDKATNIKDLAVELNLGLDSFVFLDDNPAERDWVRKALPEVEVVNLPEDPALYVQCLRDINSLWVTTLTDEDLGRVSGYRSNDLRNTLQMQSATYDEYLSSLEMKAKVQSVNSSSLNRTVQLINKTNQFNLTTRRYNEADVYKMLEDRNHWQVLSLCLTDVYQNYGQVGCAILNRENNCVTIDVLLMSCRVLGRTVERAFMSALFDVVNAWGAKEVKGVFIPSTKNQQVALFYSSCGFEQAGLELDDGTTVWTREALPISPAQSVAHSLVMPNFEVDF